MSAVLVTQISISQQHVARDRAYTQSLTVAEAGLNQYLWMVASGSSADMNNFKIPGDPTPNDHHHVYELTDPYNGELLGRYAMQVTPPSAGDSRVTVRVTGLANSPTEVPRTIEAHLGRPAFSEYILLVDEQVYIGPLQHRHPHRDSQHHRLHQLRSLHLRVHLRQHQAGNMVTRPALEQSVQDLLALPCPTD